jgi:hypothetical protein
VKIGLELTEVSGADAVAGGLGLDPDDAVAEVEGDVEGLGVSPRLEDDVAAAEEFGYEQGFHPLAAFFEGPESIALSHHPLFGLPVARSPKRKGVAQGPRLNFLKFYSIVILYHFRRGKSVIFPEIFTQHCQQLSRNHLLLSY